MMLTLLAATALAVVKFPGGNPNDFAANLAEAAKQSVVVVQGEGQMVDACEYDTSDLNELARAIRGQTKLAIMPGTELILSDGYLARDLVQPQVLRLSSTVLRRRSRNVNAAAEESGPDKESIKLFSMNSIPLPAKALENGKVTFSTQKTESLDLMSLGSVLSKPVKTHWIFKNNAVCCRVDGMPELDFLNWIAKGVGGRVVATEREYTLDIDANEIRRRAIKTINLEKYSGQNADLMNKRRTFRVTCLNSLNPSQLSTALASQGGQARVELDSRSPLTRTAVAYVQMMEQAGVNNRGRRTTSVLQRVDPSRKAYLIVNSRFETTVEVPVLDSRGNSGGVVRF